MRSCQKLIIWSIAAVFILTIPGVSLAGYDYIDINQPYLKKLPLAVPYFKKISTGDDTDQLSRTLSDLLANTLDFTGYFKIMNREAFLVKPQSDRFSRLDQYRSGPAGYRRSVGKRQFTRNRASAL